MKDSFSTKTVRSRLHRFTCDGCRAPLVATVERVLLAIALHVAVCPGFSDIERAGLCRHLQILALLTDTEMAYLAELSGSTRGAPLEYLTILNRAQRDEIRQAIGEKR